MPSRTRPCTSLHQLCIGREFGPLAGACLPLLLAYLVVEICDNPILVGNFILQLLNSLLACFEVFIKLSVLLVQLL